MSTANNLENISNDVQNNKSSNISINQMFDINRVDSYLDMFLIFLYFPIGLCLFTIRLFIFLHVLLVSSFLPRDSYMRSIIFRTIFFVLGIMIQEDNIQLKKFKAQLIISNHVTDFDPLIINLIYPCEFASSTYFPRYISWLFEITSNDSKNNLSHSIKNNSMPVVCYPEMSHSNGRFGLFKFEIWPFKSNLTSHLVYIEKKKSPILDINLSPLGANWLANLFWLLFTPISIFNIRYLSSVEKEDNETEETLAKRVQLRMAELAKLEATNFDNSDKTEMIKRLRAEQLAKNDVSSSRQNNTSRLMSTNVMAQKVKEVLPQVPFNAILSDIELTKNIDDTIERILTGQVIYVPEPIADKSSLKKSSSIGTSSSTISNNLEPSSSLESGKLFYCGANSFGKSANERASSFQERKEHLFRVARLRYIQNHGLSK